MKYGIWRHENALGNSACHVLALGKYIRDTKDEKPIVYVENIFQAYFVLCIPNIEVRLFQSDVEYTGDTSIYQKDVFKDIKMPSVYPFPNTFPADWKDIIQTDYRFKIPDDYENELNLPKDAIVITIRERGTYNKRIDGADSDPIRSVNPQTFFDVALHYANKGFKVIRLGDKNQTPMPKHKNIVDLAKRNIPRMMDDLYVVANCKVHLSCDSGIWPMTVGFGSKLILSNVMSALNNRNIVEWMPKEYTKYMYKKNEQDNTFEELIEAVEEMI